MSTETTWTAEDNCSAFEQTTITHVNRINELELQVERLKEILGRLEWCAIRSSESESTGAIHRYYCCPVCSSDKRWGKHLTGCNLFAALSALPATQSPRESE